MYCNCCSNVMAVMCRSLTIGQLFRSSIVSNHPPTDPGITPSFAALIASYSGEDCSVAETAGDESAVVHGAYPGSWGECDTKCGGGMRRVLSLPVTEGFVHTLSATDTNLIVAPILDFLCVGI